MPSLTLDDRRIRYQLTGPEGAEPPLVLIHGAAGGRYVWQEQIEGLAQDTRLLAIDLPGHGASDALDDISVATYADVVHRVTQALGLPRYVPLGHSMGGAITLTLALSHPAHVAAIILVATGARLPVGEMIFAAIDNQFDALTDLMAQVAYAPTTPAKLIAKYTGGPIQATADTVRADFASCQAFDVRTRLAEIQAPALILGGAVDQLVGQGRLHQLAAGLPTAELIILEDAGHMVMQEQAAAVNQAIRAFLKKVGTQP